METQIDGFAIISFLAIGQALLLILILVTKKQNNRLAAIYLALILSLFAFKLFHHFLIYSRYIIYFPQIFGTGEISLFAIGPLLFLYVQTTIRQRPFRWLDLLHFLPFLIFNLYRSSFYFDFSIDKLQIITRFYQEYLNQPPGPDLQFMVEALLWDLHPMIYSILTIRLLVSYQNQLKDSFSFLETINWSWLKHILTGYLMFSLLQTISYIGLAFWFNTRSPELYWAYYTVILSGLVFIIAYKGQLTTPNIIIAPPENPIQDLSGHSKYKTSPLTNKESEKIIQQLKEAMEVQKLFLDKTLSLPQLAEKLVINPNYLSQILNQKLGNNFYDYVNNYRVQAAKELLLNEEGQRFTLEAIAQHVGFNSKSAFNRAFKKHTQVTPSQFKKEYLLELGKNTP